MPSFARAVAAAAAFGPLVAPLGAQAVDPVLTSWTESATRLEYNGALDLTWSRSLGDWVGPPLGTSTIVPDLDRVQTVRFPVTGTDLALVRSGGTNVIFNSSEAIDPALRPVLIVNDSRQCAATRDTTLYASTVVPRGADPILQTSGTILIAFDDCGVEPGDSLKLQLTTTASQFGAQTVVAYRPDPNPHRPPSPVAADGTEADVVMRISGDAWRTAAMPGTFLTDRNTILADGSLWAIVPTGSDTATNAYYSIPAAVRAERMFLRYTMTVATDWWTDTGGKWPGLTNTGQGDRRAVKAGWGGRQADGTQWSARLQRQVHGADPFAASHINVQPYMYRVNRVTLNGDSGPSSGVFRKGQTVTVDQMVEMNSIDANGNAIADGRHAIWIDGVCVSSLTGIVWRTNASPASLQSEVWLDTYEGGTGVRAPHPMGVRYGSLTVSHKLLP